MDELGNRFQDYIKLKLENVVYGFMCTYVRRIKLDIKWKELLTKCLPYRPGDKRHRGIRDRHHIYLN